ncbi:hypothetical protein ACGF5S_31290 [Nocardia nova]|uniref:hypothetical protein n=1 Tax=Nocardia nova TaxID=37330 RepID=UPI003714FC2D
MHAGGAADPAIRKHLNHIPVVGSPNMTKMPMLDQQVRQRDTDEGRRNHKRPRAVGMIRPSVSSADTSRHALAIERHAERLGYDYVYTVRPPEDRLDPVGYGLAIALGIDAAAVVVYDLTTVDHSPARVCDWCDLETVCPPETWARSPIAPEHAGPPHPLTESIAQRIMQQHKGCSAHRCPRKAAAFGFLVRAGKVVPPVHTLRERAAARGIRLDPIGSELPVTTGADLGTLLSVLDGLVADMRDR